MAERAKILFLLGGRDLEMLAIKELLQKNAYPFIDNNLSWGAKLSSYKKSLQKHHDKTIYGIELEEDITPPSNYIPIDHHNVNTYKPSALEQVATLLGVTLSKREQLIAINDKNYIKGMQSFGAIDQEIEEIRRLDREAQGISKEEESLAEKSIAQSDSNVIYALCDKFSAISDRIFAKYAHYILYNDTTLSFYAYKIAELQQFLATQGFSESDYYYGGGSRGFLGIKEGVCSQEKIKKLIKEFVTMQKQKEVLSYHTFMFPFVFNGAFTKGSAWKYKKFTIGTQRDYNEFVYFYKHVQDALFNKAEEESEAISKYYEYKAQEGSYTIDCSQGLYTLALDGISLRIFNTNIAILSINLLNREYDKEKDILAINDFGRRIYPQFLGANFTQEPKEAFLAKSITLSLDNQESVTEDFSKFDNLKNIQGDISFLPNFLSTLLEGYFQQKLRPIIDDRMFVLSLYNCDHKAKSLARFHNGAYQYEKDEFWYKYIFVDGKDKTCQSRHMTQKLLKESSYERWVEWGTLFGVSRYSFVALSGHWFGNNRLLPHMQTMYFQIFTLLLAYRATIIKFADEVQNITTQKDEEKLIKDTKELYQKYLRFLNKLYFKELTAQDQGIELYNQAMKIMDIDKYMQDLDNEMNELHSYVDMIEEKRRNERLEKLNQLGYIFLPATLIAGIFGMNTFPDDTINNVGGLLFSFAAIGCLTFYLTKKANISIIKFFKGES